MCFHAGLDASSSLAIDSWQQLVCSRQLSASVTVWNWSIPEPVFKVHSLKRMTQPSALFDCLNALPLLVKNL